MRTKLIKVVSLLLAISLLTIAATVVATASEETAPFTLVSSEVQAGKVTISVTSTSDRYAVQGTFSVSDENFELESISVEAYDAPKGEEISDLIIEDPTSGKVSWADLNFDSNGEVIVTATYKVADDITPGDYTLSFALDAYGDENGNPVRYTGGALTTTVTIADESAGLKGDVDLDGKVGSGDVTRLLEHVAGIQDLTDPVAISNGEVTGDGELSSADVTKILEYVAGIISSLN
ncbi:MAG: hypothetical protein E7627_04775 [Ruminococcaceae bacterium]|nr:hypothetical protein [Oscillospiraceae bacterium]